MSDRPLPCRKKVVPLHRQKDRSFGIKNQSFNFKFFTTMGTVKATWLLPSHSGRPCHHENIYTKMNKKTGKCYSVKLCYPNTEVTPDQAAQRNKFGLMNQAVSAWLTANKVPSAIDHAVYQSVKTQFDRQTKYSSLRGYMIAKGMAEVQPDSSVMITIGTYSVTVTNGVIDTGDDDEGGSY